jgi:heptosyltransferase-2
LSVALLLVGPSWVGDLMMAHSLILVLAQREPQPAVDVLAPEWSLPLLARMPKVRTGIALPLGHGELGWGKRRTLGLALSGRYHQAIVLPNSCKSALIPYFAKIPQRTGFSGELRYGLLNDRRHLDTRATPQLVQRFVALGLPADAPLPPIPAPKLQPESPLPLLARLGLSLPDAPLLALCPGAEYGLAKRWPPERYAELARHYLARGYAVWVFGSGKDAAVGDAVTAAAPGCVNLCGQTALSEAVDLLALATVVVTNDSGLMHVAAALARPLVALYGASDPGYTPPLGTRARVLCDPPACAPCFQRECRYGHYDCLMRLSTAQVREAVDALVAG